MLPNTTTELIELIRGGQRIERPRYDGTGRDNLYVEFTSEGEQYHATYAPAPICKLHGRGAIWAVYSGPAPRLCDALDPILHLDHLDIFPGRIYSSTAEQKQ